MVDSDEVIPSVRHDATCVEVMEQKVNMEELPSYSRNPVLQNMIAKLDLDFFQDCDPTPVRVTQKITGKSVKSASCLLLDATDSRRLPELPHHALSVSSTLLCTLMTRPESLQS